MSKKHKIDWHFVARNAARCAGLFAVKSQDDLHTPTNLGGLMLIDPVGHTIIDGQHFELTAEQVFELCNPEMEQMREMYRAGYEAGSKGERNVFKKAG